MNVCLLSLNIFHKFLAGFHHPMTLMECIYKYISAEGGS